jgi:hypothetical protein
MDDLTRVVRNGNSVLTIITLPETQSYQSIHY